MKYLWLLVSLTALLDLDQCKGLEFSINRNEQELPEDGSSCAILLCEVKTSDSKDIRSTLKTSSSSSYSHISSLVIFRRITSPSDKNSAEPLSQIAAVTTNKPRFQQVINGIKGYGHLEAGYAMLRVQLRKSGDCESDFTCQVEGVDSEGREKTITSNLLQQPKERDFADGDLHGLSSPVTVQLLSTVQQIFVKMALVERSQESLDSQMNVLEHRLEDKIDAGFKTVDDKLCELESKLSAGDSDSSRGEAPAESENELKQMLSDTVAGTRRIESTLNDTTYLLSSFITNSMDKQTCGQVLNFLAENLTSAFNKFSSDREYLVEEVGDQMTQLLDGFDTIIQSFEASISNSTSILPDILQQTLAGVDLTTSDQKPPEVCKKGQEASEPYLRIEPSAYSNLDVPFLCDTTTDGGGWVVIQRRVNGDTDFFRDWEDYKNGFGTLSTDFWLGNDNIHKLTSTGKWELRVELKFGGKSRYAYYNSFSVDDEDSKYELHVSGYNGTAGDSLTRHDGHPFTTKDRDNDDSDTRNCATRFEGAWWYINCHDSNLNGRWMSTQAHHGLMWREFTSSASATFSQMEIRQIR